MVKLILCDIDWTILPGGHTELDPRLFEEIHRLTKKGIIFCPASGRQYSSLAYLFRPIIDDIYMICENGAIIFGPGKTVVEKNIIDRDIAMALSNDIVKYPDIEIAMSGGDVSYLIPKDKAFPERFGNATKNNIAIVSSPEDVTEDIIKISAHHPHSIHRLTEIENELKVTYGSLFSIAQAGNNWLDFTTSDKGTGMETICRHFGIDRGDVMAFGDNYNDMPMLLRAGHPYLMECAPQELKRQISSSCSSVLEVLRSL